MNPWTRPWKPFIPLVKWMQVAPLIGTIPQLWQAVLAVLLPLLLIIYYVFLVVDASPWHRPDRKPPTETPSSQRQGLSALSHRRRKRRQRG